MADLNDHPLHPDNQGHAGNKLIEHFKKRGMLYLIGLGAATVILLIMAERNKAVSQAATSANPYDTGQANPSGSNPDQLWGSQLDTDYQQMISNQNTTNSLQFRL